MSERNPLLGRIETPEGRRRATMLPMTRPEGMSGLEAVRSGEAELALPGLFSESVNAVSDALDVMDRVRRGEPVSEAEALDAAMVGASLGLTGGVGSLGRGSMDVVSAGGYRPPGTGSPPAPRKRGQRAPRRRIEVEERSWGAGEAGAPGRQAPGVTSRDALERRSVVLGQQLERLRARYLREMQELGLSSRDARSDPRLDEVRFQMRELEAEQGRVRKDLERPVPTEAQRLAAIEARPPSEFRLLTTRVGGRKVSKPAEESGAVDPYTGEARRVRGGSQVGRRIDPKTGYDPSARTQYLEVPRKAFEFTGLRVENLEDPLSRMEPDGSMFYLHAGPDTQKFLQAWRQQAPFMGLPEQPRIRMEKGGANVIMDRPRVRGRRPDE